MGAEACVIDHDIGRGGRGVELVEQPLDFGVLAGVAGQGTRSGFLDERGQISGRARRERHREALAREGARERGAQSGTGANDKGLLEYGTRHGYRSVRYSTGNG